MGASRLLNIEPEEEEEEEEIEFEGDGLISFIQNKKKAQIMTFFLFSF